VALLERELAKILNIEQGQNMVIVGAGNVGQAIASYRNFQTRGFYVKGLFDINPKLIGLVIGDVRVRDVDEIPQVVEEENISVGVIAVPAEAAQATADLLVQAGIRGIWNFAPVELQVPEGIPVQNEHLSVGLLTLSYLIKNNAVRSPKCS
jgi:redox-sensing transcriptional repressor